MKINPDKCVFLGPTCVGLGHLIDKDGIHPTAEKVSTIQKATAPTSVTEFKSYLGLVNYYHRFMRNLSGILAPLYKLLQKDQPWEWGDDQQRAFDKSKELLQSSRVLLHYDPKVPLILSCDASPYSVGAVLSHKMADGFDKPIAYASRSLSLSRSQQVYRCSHCAVFDHRCDSYKITPNVCNTWSTMCSCLR